MLCRCPRCGKLFETSEENAYNPDGELCPDCYFWTFCRTMAEFNAMKARVDIDFGECPWCACWGDLRDIGIDKVCVYCARDHWNWYYADMKMEHDEEIELAYDEMEIIFSNTQQTGEIIDESTA